MKNNTMMNNNNVTYTNLYGGMKVVNVPVNEYGEMAISEKLYSYYRNALSTGKMLTSKKALCEYGLDCLDASLDIAYDAICNMISSDLNVATRKDAYRAGYDAIASALYDMGVVTRRKGDWLTSVQYHAFRDAVSYKCSNGTFSFVAKSTFRKSVLNAVFALATGNVTFKSALTEKQLNDAYKRLTDAVNAEKYVHDCFTNK